MKPIWPRFASAILLALEFALAANRQDGGGGDAGRHR